MSKRPASQVGDLASQLNWEWLEAWIDGRSTDLVPHVHPIAEVTGLQDALNGKASSVHTHAIADVANLQSSLDAKIANPMTTTGDLIRGGSSGAPTRLGVGGEGNLLRVTGGVPAWAAAGSLTQIPVIVEPGADGVNGTGSPTSIDDSTAIQALLNTAGAAGRSVVFKPGTYRIGKPLVWGLNAGETDPDGSQHVDQPVLTMEPGAVIRANSTFASSAASGRAIYKPLLLVLGSDSRLMHPNVQGTGLHGSGVCIRYGGGSNWRGLDSVTTTLSTSTTNDQTTITVSDASAFPEVPGFFVEVEAEMMFVTAVNGATWTVMRGQDGTGAVTHAGGVTVAFEGFETVYRGQCYNPNLSNAASGIEFGIKVNGQSSTGDHNIWGGYITGCTEGVTSKGFVNRLIGTMIGSSLRGVDIKATRQSSRCEVRFCTINDSQQAAVWVRGGNGTVIESLWAEDSDGAANASVIRLGDHPDAYPTADGGEANSTATGTLIVGDVKIHGDTVVPNEALVDMVQARSCRMELLTMSTNGGMPTVAAVRAHAQMPANSFNVVECLQLAPGSGGLNRWPTTLVQCAPYFIDPLAGANCLIVKSHYGTTTSTASTVHGRGEVANPMATVSLFKDTAKENVTYFAKDRYGHMVKLSADVSTPGAEVSGLKACIDAVKAKGVHIHFAQPTTYSFLPSTGSTHPHSQYNVTLLDIDDMIFSGVGQYATLLTSSAEASSPDSEPLSFTRCCRITVRDIGIHAQGAVTDQTSDSLDFDAGSECLVERVYIPGARGNGIHFDGKDANHTVSGATWAAGVATVTVSTSHSQRVGMWVTVSGVTPTGFNGTHRVTARTSTTVSFELRADPGAFSSGGTMGAASVKNTIRDCHITGCAFDGIEILASSDNTIINNHVFDNGGHGIQLAKSSASTSGIQNNKKSDGNRVIGNTIDGNGQDGINILSSDRNLIQNNVSQNNSRVTASQDGIQIEIVDGINGDNNSFLGNMCTGTQQRYGINVSTSAPADAGKINNTLIMGNVLVGNGTGALNTTNSTNTRTTAGGDALNVVA